MMLPMANYRMGWNLYGVEARTGQVRLQWVIRPLQALRSQHSQLAKVVSHPLHGLRVVG